MNADAAREFAGHVRDFASQLENTHQAASSTISQMSAAYSGSSYEQLIAAWAHMSSSHMHEFQEGCNVVAIALDGAADVTVAMKMEAVGQLAVMAATFVADHAAALATFSLIEAAEAAVIAATKEVVKHLEQQLVQHITGEVIGKAVEPLKAADIKKIIDEMHRNATKTVTSTAERQTQTQTQAVLRSKLKRLLTPERPSTGNDVLDKLNRPRRPNLRKPTQVSRRSPQPRCSRPSAEVETARSR